mgnify:CR=1 FL=1
MTGFGVVFIILGAVVSILAIINIVKGIRSNDWPSVEGKLLSIGNHSIKGVLSERILGDEAYLMAGTKIKLSYKYNVEGIDYQGKRFSFADTTIRSASALRLILDEYQNNKTVNIYFQPENPSNSVLQRGIAISNFTALIPSLLFIALGVIVLFYSEQALNFILAAMGGS